jgi:hypothetical protein
MTIVLYQHNFLPPRTPYLSYGGSSECAAVNGLPRRSQPVGGFAGVVGKGCTAWQICIAWPGYCLQSGRFGGRTIVRLVRHNAAPYVPRRPTGQIQAPHNQPALFARAITPTLCHGAPTFSVPSVPFPFPSVLPRRTNRFADPAGKYRPRTTNRPFLQQTNSGWWGALAGVSENTVSTGSAVGGRPG